MKLSCQSNAAVLSLFVFSGGSDAFAPSTSTTPSTMIRLQAAGGSELTGLLSEYSGSASSAAPAVTKMVEKVASAVVSSAPTTPTAPTVDTLASINDALTDNMAAINDAVSAAQDAAEQAALAAASIAAKSAPVIKAAASGIAAGGVTLKPLAGNVFVPVDPSKFGFVPVDPSKINTDYQFDASARAKENIALLKANFIGMGESLNEWYESLKSIDLKSIEIPKFEGETVGGGVDMSDFSSLDLQAIVDSLHLQENGGWYAAAALAIIASQQKSSGKEEATLQFESELIQAQQKANEAALAAGKAAEGARLAKDLATKMEMETKMDGSKAMLESSKMKKIMLEKETMEQKVRDLEAEVSRLIVQLETAEEGKKKEAPTVVAAKKTEIEEEYPNKVVMEGDPEEDARIIELLKLMDEENKVKKAKVAAEAEKKREEEAKYVAAQKNVDKKMTKGVEAAQAKAEVETKKKVVATKKKSTTTKAKAKAATAKKTATKNAAPAPVASAASSVSDDDWTQLTEATLKRKTVAELTEYLTGKGVSVAKTMKKADLLDAVKSL